MTKAQLLDRVCVMMGGRAAEEVALGDVSTGAHNDLERASETVRQMACHYGMSDVLGPVTFGRRSDGRFLGGVGFAEERNFSEETARLIDAEVRRVLEEQYARAREILVRRRAAMQAIADRLLEVETLDRPELGELVAAAERKAA
jgi:cell division protease FtsH